MTLQLVIWLMGEQYIQNSCSIFQPKQKAIVTIQLHDEDSANQESNSACIGHGHLNDILMTINNV